MIKIFYWSPFTSKVATVKSVINSAESLNRLFKKTQIKTSIIDAVHEWANYKDEINEKKIELIHLNKNSIFNSFKKIGFIRSRIAYLYIIFKSFFPLVKTLQQNKPDFLIIHLITSLPLFLFAFKNFRTKLILRISGLPKMTLFRKFLWKFAVKNVYKQDLLQEIYDSAKEIAFADGEVDDGERAMLKTMKDILDVSDAKGKSRVGSVDSLDQNTAQGPSQSLEGEVSDKKSEF